MTPDNVRLLNVVTLGFAFMLVFTAFQTMGNIQTTLVNSIPTYLPSFHGDGYISLCIIYAVFAICNWIAPSVISVLGNKFSMIVGAITYSLFIANYLYPLTWLFYLASVVVGVGAAIIWTAQGSYLTLNSNSETMARNSGMFWALLQCSMFFGNIFVFFEFSGTTTISSHTRMLVSGVLFIISLVGIALLFTLRKPPDTFTQDGKIQHNEETSPLAALQRSFQLFLTKNMILLSFTFFYTGIELSFFSGVYGTSLGNTIGYYGNNAKRLLGLNGILIGVGEVLGGALFGLLGTKTTKYGRDIVVLLGFLLHMISYYIIFLNIPNAAPVGETCDGAYIYSNEGLALTCSFMLGFGDACYNTQIYSIVGSLYPDKSAPAFALFKFVQSVASAIAFLYTAYTPLYPQLAILVVFGVTGTVTFWLVEWSEAKKLRMVRKDTSCIEGE